MRIEDFAATRVITEHDETSGELPWVLPIEHFSATQLHMAEICPRQWQQRYLLDRKEAPGQALVLGSVTHHGIEYGLDIKLVTGNEPQLANIVVYYQDAIWPQAIERYGGLDEVIWDDKPETVRAKGVQLITTYHPRIAYLEPESIEHEFKLDIGLPVPMHGYIDLVQANERPSIEFKTSSRKVYEPKSQWRMQGRVYQLVVPRPVDYHVITTKSQTPEVLTGLDKDEMVERYSVLIAEQTKRRIAETLRELNYFYATLGPDEDWPMRGIHHDWRCSPKWCAYRLDCPIWDDRDPDAVRIGREVFGAP